MKVVNYYIKKFNITGMSLRRKSCVWLSEVNGGMQLARSEEQCAQEVRNTKLM